MENRAMRSGIISSSIARKIVAIAEPSRRVGSGFNLGSASSVSLSNSSICNAADDPASFSSSSIWNGFSDFFRSTIQPETTCRDESAFELPLMCPTSIPFQEDPVDGVLSHLLYAGLGNIGWNLDGLFSVIFPRAPPAMEASRFVSAEELGSAEAFHMWLKARLPDGGSELEEWGRAQGSKRVGNLWRELVEGEISMEDSCPPKRTVNVASVHIRNEKGYSLVEAYQEMADGRIRERNRPLSEKMKAGENVEEACLRGIYEELGCELGAKEKVVLMKESYRRVEEERESFSYPGLLTKYIIHSMPAYVQHLPSTDFDTEEDEDAITIGASSSSPSSSSSCSRVSSTSVSAAVGVRRHFWKWVK